jgi:hypothetical protein
MERTFFLRDSSLGFLPVKRFKKASLINLHFLLHIVSKQAILKRSVDGCD